MDGGADSKFSDCPLVMFHVKHDQRALVCAGAINEPLPLLSGSGIEAMTRFIFCLS